VTLPPDGYVLVVSFSPENTKTLRSFRMRYGFDASVPIFGPYSGRLSNSGERIGLHKPGQPIVAPDPDAGFVPYVLVDEVVYSNAEPWPTGADGTGDSLQRLVSGEYGDDPINWQLAAPTPGGDNAGENPLDADGDGMPDDWERYHFGGTDVPGGGAAEDWDKDRLCNLGEWVAGTNPTDASSVLAFSSIIAGPESTITIRWYSVSNKCYSILKSTDLMVGFDQIEAANIPADPPENSYTIDRGLAESAFYRIVVDE